MAKTTLRLTPATDVWKAWVGFNFSHSLGAVGFGLAVILAGRSPESFAAQAPVFLPFAFVVASIFALLAALYWFKTPLKGCLFATVCFLAAWVLAVDGEGAAEAVRLTARVSLVFFCVALASAIAARAPWLRSLAYSHGVHLLFVGVLALRTGGANLADRGYSVRLLGGMLAYAVIFYGAWRPTAKATTYGLFWVAIVFLASYVPRTMHAPWPYGISLVLLAAALAAGVRVLLRSPAAETA
jgi:hypothetical protein